MNLWTPYGQTPKTLVYESLDPIGSDSKNIDVYVPLDPKNIAVYESLDPIGSDPKNLGLWIFGPNRVSPKNIDVYVYLNPIGSDPKNIAAYESLDPVGSNPKNLAVYESLKPCICPKRPNTYIVARHCPDLVSHSFSGCWLSLLPDAINDFCGCQLTHFTSAPCPGKFQDQKFKISFVR